MKQFGALNQMPDILKEPADGRKGNSSNTDNTVVGTTEAIKDALETSEISSKGIEIITDPDHFQANPENGESIMLGKITKTPEKWGNSNVMRHKVYEARLRAVIDYYYTHTNELGYPSTHGIMWELNDQGVLGDIESLLRDEFEDKAEILISEGKITLVDNGIDINGQQQIQAISADRNKIKAFVSHIIKGIIVFFIEDGVISGTQYEDYKSIEQLAKIVGIEARFLKKMHRTGINQKTTTFQETLKNRGVVSISESMEMISETSKISEKVFGKSPF